jgi:hypothetical protein
MSKTMDESNITVAFAEQVYKASQSFANGIYVPTPKGEGHPCRWEFISFDGYECSTDVESEPIEDYNISDGYGSEAYQDKTLLEILHECHGVLAFEINQIDW